MRTLLCGAAALAALLAIAPAAAVASAEVSGSPQAVSIKAQNSSIEEILSLLGREFNMQYQSSANLEKQLTGTYQGSLQRVVSRVLEGYNFVVKMSNGRIEVTVFGTKSAPGTVVRAAIPAAPKTSPDAATAAPAVEAKTHPPSNTAVEPPPTGSGPGPKLVPAKTEPPAPGLAADGAAPAATLSPSPSPQAPDPTLGPASSAPSLAAAPQTTGPTPVSASAGAPLSPTTAPAVAGPTLWLASTAQQMLPATPSNSTNPPVPAPTHQ